ncbi:Globin domain containing protein [Trichuris trichiura]|uniref:Globin domain containing protein n=1 Tax=Trichuris trichiura TaxID=36087 RepID=A0A077Z7R6_TRITR|nr:Globin domain containing protein [Trichuris trichiura]
MPLINHLPEWMKKTEQDADKPKKKLWPTLSIPKIFRRGQDETKNEEGHEQHPTTDQNAITFTDQAGNTIIVKPDPRIPLTPKQCFLLIQNWRAIKRRILDTGIRMFIKLFQNNEDLMTFFPKVKVDEATHTYNTEVLESHAEKVMGVLDQAVHLVGDANNLLNLVNEYAEYHAKKQNFQPTFFLKIAPALLEAIKETLGDSYTENMANIYNTFFQLLIGTLVANCQAAIQRNAGETMETCS